MKPIRLGVNIDHVATIRNARGIEKPDPLRAALLAYQAGADGITAHLREDRRHISDEDIARLKANIPLPLNLEMAPTDEMLAIALKTKPHAACIVPERRQELTTEGGLDVIKLYDQLSRLVPALLSANIRVSLFIEPDREQINAAHQLHAHIVELHTGTFCACNGEKQEQALAKIVAAATYADQIGLECHAGHGLSYDTVQAIAAIPELVELNIGHFLIGEAIFVGLAESIKQMKLLMHQARGNKK